MAGQDVGGRAADLQGELGRELLAGQAADAVGAEQGRSRTAADAVWTAGPCYPPAARAPSAAAAECAGRRGLALENCGRLRAFFRPYFLRSTMRGSRGESRRA